MRCSGWPSMALRNCELQLKLCYPESSSKSMNWEFKPEPSSGERNKFLVFDDRARSY